MIIPTRKTGDQGQS